MKSFESWTFEDVELEFAIEKNKYSEVLKSWLSTPVNIAEKHKWFIDEMKENLLDNVDAWNEEELKMQFIAPLLKVVNFSTKKYNPFSQRRLSLKTDTVATSGLVDMMVATGKVRPREPFFFLHEYKQQHPSKKNDPLGQLLIAMLTAQFKNNNQKTVYGVLVEGRSWYFVVLNNKEYSVSNIYDACTDSIYQIYSILCKVKEYIEEIIKSSQ